MSDETPAQSAAAQPSEAAATTTAAAAAAAEEGVVLKPVASGPGAKSIDSDSTTEAAELKGDDLDEPTEPTEESTSTEKAVSSDTKPTEPDVEMANKPADETNLSTAGADNESKKAVEPASVEEEATTQAAEDAAEGTANETELPTSGDKSRARRKSAGDSKAKKLNKKASRVKILHVDAKPGDHYFAKLKGFPPWPVIIAEEGMLPQSMLGTRPVTAARPDGTYREDFADGGKRIADRTFPVMYLHTNEFSWTTNTDLSELDPTTVASLVTTKMRKDLQNAHLLAAEQNSLEYYKTVLQEFEEQRLAQAEADAAKKAKANKTPKKSSKAAETVTADEDDDIDMADVDDGDDVEQPAERKSKSKKRKADDNSAPQRSESVKKPKIKLTNLPSSKGANGVKSPTKDASPKPVKIKAKSGRSSKEKADNKEKEPKEPELSPEERHVRKEKEILFLRHRLQKGLLLRDQEPKEEEMKSMSEFLAKLETFPDLEVSVIRVTKINKVLKAILKLETIPKEGEFQFKPRSQTLLDKWNKILATDGAASAPTSANGVNGAPAGVAKDGKETTNGVKAEPDKADSKNDVADKEAKESEAKEDSASEDKPDAAESTKAPTDKVTAEVESTA